MTFFTTSSKISRLNNKYFQIFLFICVLFLTSGSKEMNVRGSAEDRVLAEAFLEELLFANAGCYTLFGDKPVTEMLLVREVPPLGFLPQETLDALEYIDSHTAENWDAWRMLVGSLNFDNYFFLELPLEPGSYTILFVNMKELMKVFNSCQEQILSVTNLSCLDEVVKKCREGDVACWQSLFKNHYLAGMMYGFGEENIQEFCMGNNPKKFSAEPIMGATSTNFTIPTFAVSPDDKTCSKYEKQREQIKEIFRDKKVLSVTIDKLLSSS